MENHSPKMLKGYLLPPPLQSTCKNRIYFTLVNHIAYFFIICFFAASCKNKPENAVEAALVEQNWQKVYDACKKDDSLLKKPETIGILGHAAIMLNKNNVSFILLTAIDVDNLKRKGWQSWTNGFVQRFPDQAIAYYLQGDAYMRNGNKEKALDCFNKSIDIDPKFALAYNARGVLYTINKDKGHATNDFNTACSSDPTIADFFVNRGTMFYDNKAPEYADKDFTKALKISKDDAFALNGKACSKLFDFNENYNKNLLDSIFYYLYNASAKLNIRFLNDNKRSLMLQVENKVFPDQKETPIFRVSDFLDWHSLRRRSLTDKYDLFTAILSNPLPETIDVKTIIKINSLLAKPDIFKNYLENSQIPDSLKSVIIQAMKNSGKTAIKENENIEIKNRIVFEQFYKGLIAPFKERDAGMSIAAQKSTWVDKIQSALDVSENSYKSPNYLSNINLNIPLGRFGSATGSASDLAQAGIHVLNAAFAPLVTAQNHATANDLDANTSRIINSPGFNSIARQNIQQSIDRDQGGAITDIRRQYTDNDTPYFLICINGLGYDSK